MANFLKRQYLTQRCILPALHYGECEYNDFDPIDYSAPRCSHSLYQIDGGPRDGEWTRAERFVF